MVALELEVLAKKFDRFGWARDTGTPVHDRLITDWMDALSGFDLEEVKAACSAAVMANPNKMPNEGHIRALILKARSGPDFDALSENQRNMIEKGICPPSMKNSDGNPNETAQAMLFIVRKNLERMKG